MEAKHTPGPWTAGWTGNVGEPGLGRPCVGTAGAADWVGPEGAEADARLIAAAPAMLGALQDADKALAALILTFHEEAPKCSKGYTFPALTTLNAIRDTIARATGGGA